MYNQGDTTTVVINFKWSDNHEGSTLVQSKGYSRRTD